MITFDLKLNKRYAMEICFFNIYRSIEDGITFFNFKCDLDLYEADHKPSFEIDLTILNISMINLNIYNMYHVDHVEYKN